MACASPDGAVSAGLPVMHVGSHVHDLDAAVEEYTALGADRWHLAAEPIALHTYDAAAGTVTPARLRVALGRLADSLLIELIEPVGGPGECGHPGLLRRAAGISHVGSWCADLPGTCRRLIATGARLLLASGADRRPLDRLAEAKTDAQVAEALRPLTTCYLELASGTRLELVGTSMWETAYPALAPGLMSVMRPPPAAS